MSKSWFDASLQVGGRTKAFAHQRFDNNTEGFKKFLTWLRGSSKKRKLDKKFIFCMEHTGIYTLPLCHFLEQKKLDFTLVSGLEIKYSLGIRRGKSDQRDAKAIAKYAYDKCNELKISKLPTKNLIILKHCLSYRARLVKTKHGISVAAGELRRFAGIEENQFVVQNSQLLMETFKQSMSDVETKMLAIIRSDAELSRLYDLVISVKCVGPIIATTMLVYTHAFQSFTNVRKFACYCSIAPFEESSGSSLKKRPQVHPLGDRKVKALLTNAAQSAVNFDKELRAYFMRKIAEGKHEGVVLNAIKFKILARIFAVVKRGTPFVERDTFRN